MLSNKQLYEIMDKLGLVDNTDENTDASDARSAAEKFVQDTCSDLCNTMNFVGGLFTCNSEEAIMKFLTVLFFYNSFGGIVSSDGTGGGWIDYGNFSERIGK